MRLYAGTTEQFYEDTVRNQLAEKLKNSFFNYFRYNPSEGEVRSWQNSLKSMAMLVQHAGLDDHGVMLEYQLPQTSRRLDFLITGKDYDDKDNAVIVELKQWDKCVDSDGENEVLTWLGGTMRDVLHPSAQVGQYKMYLEDTHTAFYEGDNPVCLSACSYLHNYHSDINDVLFSPKFSSLLAEYPTYTADDYDKIRNFLLLKLDKGKGIDVLKRIEQSKYRPSKTLMNHVGNVIRGKSEYILLDEQKVVYDMILAEVKGGFHTGKKSVIIIKGGPGTGKSVIAINLMADLLLKGYNAHYATGSRAFTETLRKIIGTRGSVQFKYFNSYTRAENNEIDVLICDEAHRIRITSNSRFTKKEFRSNQKQIDEILNSAKVSVFFIDDNQVVRPGEIGSVNYIREAAEKYNSKILDFELETQFRCNGSDAFINWINNTLGIKRTANVLWKSSEETFDFRIFNSPDELENAIQQKVKENYTARMTAGYCWPWSNPDHRGMLPADVVIGNFQRPWNAKPEATKLAPGIPKAVLWAYEPTGINQIGCVYTAQGFEFDYIGVIIGKDISYDFDRQIWIGNKSESFDPVVKKAPDDKFLDYIKNTYRVLLTRGMKGCYVYFQDKSTEHFFKSRME